MDAFEQLVGQLLEYEKYWVQHSVKVDLDSSEKEKISKKTTPRPEIDIAAFDIPNNTVYLLEVKSYLDSPGVKFESVIADTEVQEGRYKILTSRNYQKVISERLLQDWRKSGHVNPDTKVSFGLIAGKVQNKKEADLEKYFENKNWLFWGPTILKQKLEELSKKGYENNAVTIAAKILLR
jgi:predicted HTH transcriptional regulator